MEFKQKSPPAKTIAAIVIGGALEWYDFIIYSLMTVYIAAVFFPSNDGTHSILVATATFGVAFFVRPIGSLILGLYADNKGRKAALLLIISIMAIAMLLIACAPSYARAGMFAPILLIVARLLQGFSASGECGAASALLYELSPPEHRGFYTSWQTAAQVSAMLLGAIVGTLLTTFFSEAQMVAFGWRIPFILGLLILPVGLYLRRQLSESVPLASTQLTQLHLHVWRANIKNLLVAIGLVVGGTVTTYINLSYIPTYAVKQLHLSMHTGFLVQVMSVGLLALCIPIFGKLSDSIGCKLLMLISIGSYFLIVYPLFSWLVIDPSFHKLIVTQLICCFLLAPFFGVSTRVAAELFPRQIRSAGLGVSSNIGVMLFGGFAQFIVTWLIKVTGTPVAIAYYLLFALGVTLIAALCYRQENIGTGYAHEFN